MGSGMGKTSTRGHKGQGSRSGSRLMRGFEGGQMPLHRRLPKRGFTNIFRTEYTIINLDRLASLGENNITPEVLASKGLAGKHDLIKVLGDGELTSAINVQAHKFSKAAQEKIAKAGGKAELIGGAVQQSGNSAKKNNKGAAPQQTTAAAPETNKPDKKKQKK
jgi:large subunit ribosomal protein L15